MLALGLATAWMAAAPALPAQAQTCDRSGCGWIACGTPATPVPANLWGELQPLDTAGNLGDRDVTFFNEYTGNYVDPANAYYFSISIQNGFAFTGTDWGFKVWDISNGLPVELGSMGYSGFPFTTAGEGAKTPIQDISLPQGVDTVGAIGGLSDMGLSIIDFSSKSSPKLVYQNAFQSVPSVYAATLPPVTGAHYVFAAANVGLLTYNMDAAKQHAASSGGQPCREDYTPGGVCPGVYVGAVTQFTPAYLTGMDQYLVASYGANVGFDIWDVTNPASPVHKLTALQDRGVAGVAMWKDPATGHYLLGARIVPTGATPPGTINQLEILDVNCITGSCGAPPPVLGTYLDPVDSAAQTPSYFLTFSMSGNTPFLYLGSDEYCGPSVPQREWLLDVSNPAAPRDITPPTTANGGYWGWYYRTNPNGLNRLMPRKGMFWGQNFYRVAQSLFDVHKHVGAVAPTAGFTWKPAAIYPGTLVNFVDQSLGQPTSWVWTFAPDGSPASSSVQSPTGVSFPTAGAKSVSLVVQNNSGKNSLTLPVNVLNPAPAVGSVSVSPASPLQCQPVTLTANSVTGQPPLTYAWAITTNNNPAQGGTSTANPFIWDTKANANPPAQYTAQVTVSGTGTPATAQATFTLGSLASLPASGTFAPTNDAFSAGTVQFHVNVAGATEWNWNFGDNPGGGPASDGYTGWTSDPVNGPNPSHTYNAVATYQVQVQVRNCVNIGGATSSPLPVQITQTTPLIASFAPQCLYGICAFASGSPVTFIDGSQGAACWDYDWDGSGGGTSFPDAGHTAPVTSHTYTVTTTTTFYPALRVHRGSCTGTEVKTFKLPPPGVLVSPNTQPAQIGVSGPTSGVPNTPYTFVATSSNCTPSATWSWTANGGTINGSATGSSISVSYAANGSYTVAASNSGCSGAFGSTGISISSGGGGGGGGGGGTLLASFTFSPGAPKAGDTVSFDGTASTGNPTAYVWDFGDGAKGSGVTTTHVYTQQGSFTVKLDVEAPGTGAGCLLGTCVNEAQKQVTVASGVQPLNPDYTSSAQCQNIGGFSSCTAASGQTVTLTAVESRATTFTWNFGDGTKGTGNPVTHSWSTGTYSVSLTVSAANFQDQTGSKTFSISGPPPLVADYTSSAGACNNIGGFSACSATAFQAVTLTATETRATSFAWDFGDGTTGSGNPVTHTWQKAGTYQVGLTVGASGFANVTGDKTFTIQAPTFQSMVLPWVAETRGALVQSCDLYLHNPGANPVDVTLQFLKRGTPDVNPPQSVSTIQPGATLFAPDVLQSVFNRDNIAGFVTVTVKATDPLPIMTSFNTVTRGDGGQFGQTIPGLALPGGNQASNSSTPAASTFQYLVGLNDNTEQLAYFGITNPSSTPATFHVRLFDNQGNKIGESNGDLTISPFGQRQFQQADVHNLFGLTSGTDYMVSVENKSGNTIFPYGENVRMGSGDPSFLTAGNTAAATQYVLGAFSTNGSWQTDLLMANTGSQAVTLTLTFTRTGVTAATTAPVTVTLNAGDTQRLSNAIAGQWNLSNVVGEITITSTAANGVYPIIQAESYNNAQPANRYGQSMKPFSDADAAQAGQTQYLVGLRQDATHLTTFWVFNNSTTSGSYDVVYRGLDGTVYGTVPNISLPPGKVRGFLPAQHPLPAGGATNGFTVQVVVKQGSVITAAQVLTPSTGDPAYVQGVSR